MMESFHKRSKIIAKSSSKTADISDFRVLLPSKGRTLKQSVAEKLRNKGWSEEEIIDLLGESYTG